MKIRVNDIYLSTHPWRQSTNAWQEGKEVDVIEIIRDYPSGTFGGSRVIGFTKKKVEAALPAKRLIKIPFLKIYIFSWI
jgi:hypothetical protein